MLKREAIFELSSSHVGRELNVSRLVSPPGRVSLNLYGISLEFVVGSKSCSSDSSSSSCRCSMTSELEGNVGDTNASGRSNFYSLAIETPLLRRGSVATKQ